MNHSVTISPGSDLEKEIISLINLEKESLFKAVRIDEKTEIGYGSTYYIEPISRTEETAIRGLHILRETAPSLLTVLLEAQKKKCRAIEIDVPKGWTIKTIQINLLSSHELVQKIPDILDWMVRTECEKSHKKDFYL